MFKKILFPTRFGEFSLDILRSIACLKAAGLEEVVLLHVIDTDSLYTEIDGGGPLQFRPDRAGSTQAARFLRRVSESRRHRVKASSRQGKTAFRDRESGSR